MNAIKLNYHEIQHKYKELRTKNIKELLAIDKIEYNTKTKIAVIVPYRNNIYQDRASQLTQFTEYYHNYIDNIDIYVIEQSEDGKKFNRGCLLNCGYDIAKKAKQYDMYIFHDVDLISPIELKNIYTYVSSTPIHIASLWKEKYNQIQYFGGISSFSADTYEKINGYPNNFYGWGGENDAVYNRLALNNMIAHGLETSKNIEIKEMEYKKTSAISDFLGAYIKHILFKDMIKWKENGLSNLQYTISNTTNIKYDNVKKYLVEI